MSYDKVNDIPIAESGKIKRNVCCVWTKLILLTLLEQ